ncbi:MAG TPA: glycosyltransferase, partial [Anaerolineae bacterium]
MSVIIPCYNEQARIGDTLTSVLAYLQARESSYEVIIVDDGSRDKTASIVESKIRGLERARLITYQPNRGKGYA